ncbi:hypothetical protein BCR42DRAFT_407893 [Absidia repens]|uniref:MHYT domain-containing protein n=1 Tax=Absidia repens TaxID=90262 RepID=A0A1X2ISS9_9FUNG|nr:hypothetical protein BCR42DRAFT_407893 [Absidia repens]
MEVEATQQFNGAIIFVSYVISVIGSMTTLELLTRRTHIQGKKNWYLLLSAALAMGSVGIWSMHFIGNNSLTLLFPNHHNHVYQLAYSGGYTFASLVVSIACMFISFSFVGVSEHVQVYRILLSGVLAGIGIATMHYLGQFAIEYFRVDYKPAYVAGAVVIACTAVTAALWIFFKLREQWMNQWYKRLGCAAIMGAAVCGMHYTAMIGTVYYDTGNGDIPPNPLLPTPALIGVICGVVVIACVALFYVGVKCSMQRIAESSNKAKKRLVVDMVLFDSCGRLLVNNNGALPCKEVLSDIQFESTRQEFSSSHPLFIRLFQVVTQWSTTPTLEDYDRTSHSDEFNLAERRFHEATSSLMESLQLENASELGLLYESVIKTHTVVQPSLFQQKRIAAKQKIQSIKNIFTTAHMNDENSIYGDTYSLSATTPPTSATTNLTRHGDTKKSLSTSSFDQANNVETSISIDRSKKLSSTIHLDYEQHATTTKHGRWEYSPLEGDEERHIMLVRQLTSDKDIHRFMINGYRFAEVTIIAKIMAAKLCIPNDYLLNHFREMYLLSQSSFQLAGATSPRVMVGLLGLVDEGQTYDDVHMVVDKRSRYSIPLVDLAYDDTGELARQLLPEEKRCLSYVFRDHSLQHMTNVDKYIGVQSRPSLNMTRRTSSSTHRQGGDISHGKSLSTSGSPTLKTSTSANLSATNLDQELASMHHHQQQHQHDIASYTSALSQTSTVAYPDRPTPIIQRFTKAMESASQKLMDTVGINGMHLGLANAVLQAETFDVPAFALTPGPCTLILFRTCLRTSGTVAAIQQHTATEPIRCLPSLLGLPLSYAITQRAVEHHKQAVTRSSWGTELKQQMLYGSFAHLNHNTLSPSYYYNPHSQSANSNKKNSTKEYGSSDKAGGHQHNDSCTGDILGNGSSNSLKRNSSGAMENSNSMPTTQPMAYRPDLMNSLPPPPRAKRIRQVSSTSSSENKDHPSNATATLTTNYQSMNEMESTMVILSARDRFLWLDQVIVECMHSILS